MQTAGDAVVVGVEKAPPPRLKAAGNKVRAAVRFAHIPENERYTITTNMTRRTTQFIDVTAASGAQGKGASMFSAIISIAATCMGTGILALPGAYAEAGLFGGWALGILGACLACLAIFLLESAAMRAGLELPTMFDLCNAVLPGSGAFVSICLVVFVIGAALTYVIVAADNVTSTFPQIPRKVFLLASACYYVPLCFLRSMDSLRIVSLLSVSCLMLAVTTILSFYVAPSLLDPCGGQGVSDPPASSVFMSSPCKAACLDDPAGTCTSEIVLLGSTAQCFGKLPSFILAYFCVHNTFTILAELEEPTPVRKAKTVGLAMALIFSFYSIVATAGYLTFGSLVSSNVLNSYPADSVAVAAVRVALAVAVLSTVPLQAYPSRLNVVSVIEMCTKRKEERIGPQRSIKMTISSSLSTNLPATLATFSTVISLKEAPETEALGDSLFITSTLDRVAVLAYVSVVVGIALFVSDLGTVVDFLGSTSGDLIFLIVPSVTFILAGEKLRTAIRAPITWAAAALGLLGVAVMAKFLADKFV
ncbi:hypothetical protein EMIHUDRAFT_108831 [Emiliania huxleyi CCMP1516]|uniref:Amino acid transporter transmembrane domain-containing protein n=2 Tax=Emiliania huxleyi TaxID=2903 RepID=A0A0D3KVR1_EMIH1|nr:hypothetical protein EMIHUDRAFT_108831 [Emiliania huxleyi CCMP1516]EOD39846.1 hypothetical protein EMIHUDRAFT_108831 [Emiliania huxleyi CCMP1516]|eukprot:XP_005792275.1 hypothetical protein EMIHUDRAFT_108831 [Emiliania huxleyi CCMP1516]